MRGLFLSFFLLFCMPVVPGDKTHRLGLFPDKAVLSLDGQRYMLGVGELTPVGINDWLGNI